MITFDGNNIVVVMLGSNYGDRASNLDNATEALRKYIDIIAISPDINSADITGNGADYLNKLLTGRTSLSLQELKVATKKIETSLGRNRAIPTEVVIDIDIITFGDEIVKPTEYNTPHFKLLAEKLGLHYNCSANRH